MKILFLTSRHPFPPIGGDKLRAYNFITYLLKKGHEVHLLSLTDRPVETHDLLKDEKVFYLAKSKSYLNSMAGLVSQKPLQVWYFWSQEFQGAVRSALEDNGYDLVFCHLIRCAEYVLKSDIPKIMDLTDAISLNYERVVRRIRTDASFRNLIYALEKKRVLQYEKNVIDFFDKSILVSSTDREYLGRFFDTSKVEVVPNGVDTDYYSWHEGGYDRNRIIFTGNMRTVPNDDAAFYFATEIFPLVKKEVPEARFLIAGADPSKRICKLAMEDADITVIGQSEDIRPYMRDAAVSVAPMRYGAGVQNKILEAMALGTPVVCTSVGLEGISAVRGRDILVGDSSEIFAKKTVELLRNDSLRESISRAGRTLIEEHYTWEKALSKLNYIIEKALTKSSNVEMQ